MPKGGKRLGSGRKPLTRRERWLGGNAGKANIGLVKHRPVLKVDPAQMGETVSFPITPAHEPDYPAVLTEEEGLYWQLWAPLARARGMLVAETVPGFVQLCQVARRCARLWSEIDRVGLTFEISLMDSSGQERHELKKHPLMSEWRGLVMRQEAMLARYGLTGDGKVPPSAEAGDAEELQLAKILAVK
jgi:hypothetical protein